MSVVLKVPVISIIVLHAEVDELPARINLVPVAVLVFLIKKLGVLVLVGDRRPATAFACSRNHRVI